MQENSFSKRNERMVYTNGAIKAWTIVIVDEEKNNIGSFPRRVALEMAEEKWLDLVQMNYDPITQTCTALLTDYGKYMYKKQKDQKEKKRIQKQRSLKELKLSYAIWENDLDFKIRKWREFLEWGDNVKFFIRLRWREKIYESKAKEKLKDIITKLEDISRTQFSTPKKEAQWYSIILFSKA
jgi:translation initiation factor IF-3